MTTEDPKLTTTRVLVEYTADDGYSASTGFKNKPETPAGAFFDALDELGRLTALFRIDDKALEAFLAGRNRVLEMRGETK